MFSDDDLKRLKEKNIGANSGKPYAQVIANRDEFDALIARLEAGEFILNEIKSHEWKSLGLESYRDTWRKAAGKKS